MKVGIVGLPNAGKSSLFNALTRAGATAANYPFTTVEPNVAVVGVPDVRLERVAETVGATPIVHETIEFHDIAGLVRGAHEGEGLGNKFLGNIRETDAILHVVRAHGDAQVVHPEGRVDPLADVETVETELLYADLEQAERRLERVAKQARGLDKEAVAEEAWLRDVIAALQEGRPVRTVPVPEAAGLALMRLGSLTAKPVLYVANVGEDDLSGKSPLVAAVQRHAHSTGAEVVVLCAELERQLAEMEPVDRQIFLADAGLQRSGLERLVQAAFHLLGLMTFYTAGPKEIRAWTIHRGDSGPRAAGVIHTDFEKNYIRAEVYSVDDLQQLGSEQAIRAAGKMRSEGREYVMRDADIAHFLVGK